VKFVERDTFRQIGRPVDRSSIDLRIGSVILLGRVHWRVVGSAPHPNRLEDLLAFVEPSPHQPGPPPAFPERRSLGLSVPTLADDRP
jgi:hypothetical protein